jgi:trehalose 6-phosphate synthase/phosphatase
VATPSRERVEQYRRMRNAVEVTVSRINGDHGRIGRPAVHYLHHAYPREELAALYLAADVLLVTALRDGMNLVAKEYVATRHDERGALVLSEFAGAAIELPQALLVNPHDIDGLKSAIMQAVHLSPREAARRMRVMRKRVFQHDVRHWADSFLQAMDDQVGPDRDRVEAAEVISVTEAELAGRVILPVGNGRQPVAVGVGPQRRPRLVDPDLSIQVLDAGTPGGPLPMGWGGSAGSRGLSARLRTALAEFAEHESVLIGLDFDGVLAPIVADPETARALPAGIRAIEQLVAVPGVRVALLSGRSLADLTRVAAPPEGVILIGSHGAEFAADVGTGPPLDDEQSALLGRVADALFAISRSYPGTRVEVKPTAAVLHTRKARRADADRATAEALAGPAGWTGAHLTRGKEVVELSVLPADKGAALRRLRQDHRSQVVLYVGDDVTDERAFAVLDHADGDVSVKVGAGETLARHRVHGPEDVCRLLDHLVQGLQD